MPYINQVDGRREVLRKGASALSAGELNYQIFRYIKHHYKEFCKEVIEYNVNNFLGENPNYQRYNDMVGCLILCGKEIKRRLNIDLRKMFKKIIDSYDDEIAKYEDTKIEQNGDVE